MKKKLIKTLVVIATIILIIILFRGYKILKANIIFGTDYCEYEDDWLHGAGHVQYELTVITSYKCTICGLTKRSGSSFIPKMCPECQELTNRCDRCGKRLHNKK